MASPRLAKKENYWKNKGIKPVTKSNGVITYKNVMLYTHDDLDGIYSTKIIKDYLINKGFNIIGYGIVNYQDSWKLTNLNSDYINVCVDYAQHHNKLDCYIDHHMGEIEDNKSYAIKTNTGSAFEGICYQYGIPLDSLTLYPIDMVDSAKYVHYNVDIKDVINFDWDIIKKSKNKKLTFTAMINQFIKRADHNTLIEVIHNIKSVSIYEIYSKLKEYYSGNNLWNDGRRKSFIEDGKWRINSMISKTRGNKKYANIKNNPTYDDFLKMNFRNNKINLKDKGYQVIGNLAFIPSGSWCNAIRARAILEEDINNGIIPNVVKFILLQYGDTLQMICFNNINDLSEDELPVLKSGYMNNIGKYMENLLTNFKNQLGYVDPSTYVSNSEELVTTGGGHNGIGSISQISGYVPSKPFKGMKWLDLFKNKIIQDISNSGWKNLKIDWYDEPDKKEENKPMDFRVLLIKDIRTNGKTETEKEQKLKIKNKI